MPGADSLELCPQQPQRRSIIVPILQLGELRGQGLAPPLPNESGDSNLVFGPISELGVAGVQTG